MATSEAIAAGGGEIVDSGSFNLVVMMRRVLLHGIRVNVER